MNKTYTPLIIEGKIYVVVNMPEPDKYEKGFHIEWHKKRKEQITSCTKYETLPEHAPYWKERIGQRVEVEIAKGEKKLDAEQNICYQAYAIPPQQKQGDEWDEAWERFKDTTTEFYASAVTSFLRQHFNLTKK